MTGSISLGRKFQSHAHVLEAIKKYSVEQGVPYVIFNSTKAATYNNNVAPPKRMPIEQGYKDMVVACKHYGKPRQSQHVEGKQRRGNQRTFKKYCSAKFNVSYNIQEGCHIVTKLEETHCNHSLDPSLAQHYPEFRRPSEATVGHVGVLFENEAKTHRIREVVLNSGVLATAQDIQNLRNKWLSLYRGTKKLPEEALFDQLKKLKCEDPNSIVVIHIQEETNVIQSIFFQTSYMRENLDKYPELLIMDTTYNLCDNEMPLIVFSVVDCFGTGQIAGYSIIYSECKQIVSKALQVLKLGCANLADKVKVVYIDKAQSEIASNKETLPNAEIHLCDYHVKENFSRTSVKKLVKENWEEVKKLLVALIHAHSKEDYDRFYTQLIDAAGGETSEFMVYFTKNWHNSDLVWCDYQRNESFTLGERTTGRVESHNAKIKKMVDKKLPVTEVILRLCVLNRNAKIENSQRIFNELSKIKYHKYSSDHVIQKILKVNTPFVGEYLRAQYERSLEPPSDTYHNVTTEKCDCKYFNQTKLICSHIFRERRLNGVELYDHKLVPQRWTVILPSAAAQNDFKNFEIITSPVKTSKNKKTMNQEERYNLAESIAKRISSLIANYGGEEFHLRINALHSFEDLMRLGKRIAVVGVDGEGQPDLSGIDSGDKQNGKDKEMESNKADHGVLAQEEITVDIESNSTTKGQTILMSGRPEETYTVLIQSEEKRLKLPVKCPVPGRPKGKRKHIRKPQSQRETPIDEEDADDITPMSNFQCTSCDGPVICRTSYSKGNRGKKYILCENPLTPACKMFHKWAPEDVNQCEDKGVNPDPPCIVCANSGPPSIDGGHKCHTCGVPVHAIDGVPCCSVATNPDEESYGGKGRECLQCASIGSSHAHLVDPRSQTVATVLNTMLLPTIPIEHVPQSCLQEVLVDFKDEATTTQVNPSQTISEYSSVDTSESFDTSLSISEKKCFGCNKPAVLRTAKTEKNYGRQFFTCMYPQSSKCKWINWKRTPHKTGLTQRPISSYLHPTNINGAIPVNSAELEDGLDDFLSNVAANIDPPYQIETSLQSEIVAEELDPSSDKGKWTVDTSVPFINHDALSPSLLARKNVTIRRKRVFSSVSEVDIKPKLQKTSEFTEIVTISSDSDSESDGEPVSQLIPAGEDCLVCKLSGPPKDSGHKCALCSTFVHAFGCSAPNPDGVEGFGGSDRLCWSCFHKVNDQRTNPAKDPVPQVNNDTCCTVCKKPSVASCQCACCMEYVHAEECSLVNPAGSDDRICMNCFCLLCKQCFNSDHVCLCHICDNPSSTEEGVICYRCKKICHPYTCAKNIRAKEKLNQLRFICQHYLYALTVRVSTSAKSQITEQKMLSDEHIVRASVMLAAQFQGKVDGLCAPMGVLYGKQVDSPNYYPKRTSNNLPWVQILNTGQEHWVTAIFVKGSSAKIMDSLKARPMSGHTKIQVAMILFSKERITISRPACKQQENGIDCGLFAIANATEFCFSSEIQYVDFDPQQLRSHWLKCLENGILRPFPRCSKRPKKVKEQEEFELVSTYCLCRLPGNYGNLIGCDKCSMWFHRIFVGLLEDGDDPEEWNCSECVAST